MPDARGRRGDKQAVKPHAATIYYTIITETYYHVASFRKHHRGSPFGHHGDEQQIKGNDCGRN